MPRSELPITDLNSLRSYLIQEESGLLTGFFSARVETAQDKRVLESCIGAFQDNQNADVTAFLTLLLAKYQATG